MERNKDQQLDTLLTDALTAETTSRQTSGFQSREEFETWLRQGEMKQRRRRQRRIGYGLAAAAAVFVCAFFLCSSHFHAALPASILPPWAPEASYAGSSSNPSITEENGSIVIGGDGNGNVGEWTATFTCYEDIPEKYQKEIIWFEELPEGYEVSKIKIQKTLQNTNIETNLTLDSHTVLDIIQIYQSISVDANLIVNQYDEILILNDLDVYKKSSSESNMYTIVVDNYSVSIIDYEHKDTKKIEALLTSIKTGWNK